MVDSPDYQKQHAFLAAVDKALVSLKFDVLDRYVLEGICGAVLSDMHLVDS